MFKMINPLWDKPSDNTGGGKDAEDEEVIEEEDEGGEEESTEEEEDFEALLKAADPKLFEKYTTHTANLVSALRKEREKGKKATKAEKELAQYKKREEEAESKNKSELEIVQADLAREKTAREAAEARLKAKKDEGVIHEIAGKLDFNKASDATLFLDMGSLERDEEDELDPKDVETKLKALVKDRPYLVKKKDLGSGNDTGDNGRHMDTDPKTKKKIKASQPKLPI